MRDYWEEEGTGGIVYGFSICVKRHACVISLQRNAAGKRLILKYPFGFSIFPVFFCNLLSTVDLLLTGREIIVRSARHDSTLEMHAVISVRSGSGCVEHAVMLWLLEGAEAKHYYCDLGK